MKVIVVVEDENRPVLFTGKKLNVINKFNAGEHALSKPYADVSNTLIIKDEGKVIAVFNVWKYWRAEE